MLLPSLLLLLLLLLLLGWMLVQWRGVYGNIQHKLRVPLVLSLGCPLLS